MNWLNKLERKFGRYAVPNLIVYLIGAYSVGFVLNMVAPNILGFLNFQPYYILHGQIWRLITWILMPTDSNIIFLLIMMMFYYQLGTALERAWGTFRFNAYIIGGILLTEVGSLLAYGLIYLFMGGNFAYTASTMMGQMISTSYINMSTSLKNISKCFATMGYMQNITNRKRNFVNVFLLKNNVSCVLFRIGSTPSFSLSDTTLSVVPNVVLLCWF
jgi:hypothetical protein